MFQTNQSGSTSQLSGHKLRQGSQLDSSCSAEPEILARLSRLTEAHFRSDGPSSTRNPDFPSRSEASFGSPELCRPCENCKLQPKSLACFITLSEPGRSSFQGILRPIQTALVVAEKLDARTQHIAQIQSCAKCTIC